MATVRELLRAGGDLPTDSPRRDAEILLSHCLQQSRTWLYTWPEIEVSADRAAHFDHLLARRREGLPVAYLTGHREFWSLQLQVNGHTLIPRPETEILVEWALDLSLVDNAAVLDLGTGSGAIALAVAGERPHWQVMAVDTSAAALQVARDNATRTGLERVSFFQSDWYQGVLDRRYHLLLSNPPYIDGDDPHLGQGDVRFEPHAALVADDGGLADLTRLIKGAPSQLHPGGWLLLEHGHQQGADVRELLHDTGFCQVTTRVDMAGHERITGACRRAE
ncbi:MAG: peptide chain release factor N(5)-glutamine methyltransferase [Gammaproteobacteria bacterium]|nr:MAG: peptide chain release factor N(5)-glutamine methyltransferase [Gammaproteobacteria bacterium]RLA60237.1 MAG: peptide chain release factor N(5)-glutamine methyltransferase [Gammaproteobacteria bacterium]